MFSTTVFLIGVSVVWLALWAYRTTPRSTFRSIGAPLVMAVPSPAVIRGLTRVVTDPTPPVESRPETALTPGERWKVRLARYLGALLPLSFLFLKVFSTRTGAAAGSLMELSFAILIVPAIAVWLIGSPWLPSIVLGGVAGSLGARHVPNVEIPWFRWKARTVRGGLFEGLLSVPIGIMALFLIQTFADTPPSTNSATSQASSLGSHVHHPSAPFNRQTPLSRGLNPVPRIPSGRPEMGMRSAVHAKATSQFWQQVVLSPFRSERACGAEPLASTPNLRITPFLAERKAVVERDLVSLQPNTIAEVDSELLTFHHTVTKHLGELRDAVDHVMQELASRHRLFQAQELFEAASDPANPLHDELSPALRERAMELLRRWERSKELRRRLLELRTSLSARYPLEKFAEP